MHNVPVAVNALPVAAHMHRGYPNRMAKVRDRPPAEATPASLGEWLVAAMAARRVDQVTLEHLTGIDQTTISRARQGRMSDRVLLQIAQALKVDAPQELLRLTSKGRRPRGAPELAPSGPTLVTGARPQRAGADVPVYHAIRHQRGPAFLLQTAVTEFCWRPTPLASCRRAFMVRMPDTSMDPWRQAAEPIYCDPDRDVAQARHALVALDTGEPHDLWLICALITAPQVGAALDARLHNQRRGTAIPALPIRRAITIVEWPDLLPV
jgi:transcriptional regulator with XRE-family HTH domain